MKLKYIYFLMIIMSIGAFAHNEKEFLEELEAFHAQNTTKSDKINSKDWKEIKKCLTEYFGKVQTPYLDEFKEKSKKCIIESIKDKKDKKNKKNKKDKNRYDVVNTFKKKLTEAIPTYFISGYDLDKQFQPKPPNTSEQIQNIKKAEDPIVNMLSEKEKILLKTECQNALQTLRENSNILKRKINAEDWKKIEHFALNTLIPSLESGKTDGFIKALTRFISDIAVSAEGTKLEIGYGHVQEHIQEKLAKFFPQGVTQQDEKAQGVTQQDEKAQGVTQQDEKAQGGQAQKVIPEDFFKKHQEFLKDNGFDKDEIKKKITNVLDSGGSEEKVLALLKACEQEKLSVEHFHDEKLIDDNTRKDQLKKRYDELLSELEVMTLELKEQSQNVVEDRTDDKQAQTVMKKDFFEQYPEFLQDEDIFTLDIRQAVQNTMNLGGEREKILDLLTQYKNLPLTSNLLVGQTDIDLSILQEQKNILFVQLESIQSPIQGKESLQKKDFVDKKVAVQTVDKEKVALWGNDIFYIEQDIEDSLFVKDAWPKTKNWMLKKLENFSDDDFKTCALLLQESINVFISMQYDQYNQSVLSQSNFKKLNFHDIKGTFELEREFLSNNEEKKASKDSHKQFE
ncbi:hypothetical protein [Holospora curviuscula]|nr:hypothetical protein [Holospora curviuscula]